MGTTITLVIITIAGLAVWLMITRGLQLKQLVEYGIDTEGRVVRQFRRNPEKTPLSTDFFLRYAYRDRNGIEHEHESNVKRDFWTAHPEGSAVMITHSKSRPSISHSCR